MPSSPLERYFTISIYYSVTYRTQILQHQSGELWFFALFSEKSVSNIPTLSNLT
jgi:hypothetical protein